MYTAKSKVEKKKLWTCPECGRKFEHKGQPHSCRAYPIELHFENKPEGKILFEKFLQAIRKELGTVKIESLECCIHLVSTVTFAAVKILKNKIRIDFTLSRKIKNNRIKQFVQMSSHRYLYVTDIIREEDIDDEIMEWISESRNSKK